MLCCVVGAVVLWVLCSVALCCVVQECESLEIRSALLCRGGVMFCVVLCCVVCCAVLCSYVLRSPV